MTPLIAVYLGLAFAVLFAPRARFLKAVIRWGRRRNPSNAKGRNWTTHIIPDYLDGAPYISRFYLPRMFGFRPMLHWIHRPDTDRHLHSHPWVWAFSIVLAGWYEEERRDDRVQSWRSSRTNTAFDIWRRVRLFNRLRATDYHKITELHGEVFTLFVAGPRLVPDRWGFLTERGWVESGEYIAERRRAA